MVSTKQYRTGSKPSPEPCGGLGNTAMADDPETAILPRLSWLRSQMRTTNATLYRVLHTIEGGNKDGECTPDTDHLLGILADLEMLANVAAGAASRIEECLGENAPATDAARLDWAAGAFT